MLIFGRVQVNRENHLGFHGRWIKFKIIFTLKYSAFIMRRLSVSFVWLRYTGLKIERSEMVKKWPGRIITQVKDTALLFMSQRDWGMVWFEFVSVTKHRKCCKCIISMSIWQPTWSASTSEGKDQSREFTDLHMQLWSYCVTFFSLTTNSTCM